MKRLDTATKRGAIDYINADHREPCRHGHYDCASTPSGECSNEVYARALGNGWIDEGGNER